MAGRTLENLKARYGGSFDPTKEGPRRGPGPGGLSFGKPQNGGEVFRRLMGYIGRYWKRLIAVLLLQPGEIDTIAVDAGGGAGFEPAQGDAQSPQAIAEVGGGVHAVGAGFFGILSDKNFAL